MPLIRTCLKIILSLFIVESTTLQANPAVQIVVLTNGVAKKIPGFPIKIKFTATREPPSSIGIQLPDGSEAEESVPAEEGVTYRVESKNKVETSQQTGEMTSTIEISGFQILPGILVIDTKNNRVLAVAVAIYKLTNPPARETLARIARTQAKKSLANKRYIETAALLDSFYSQDKKKYARTLLNAGRAYAGMKEYYAAEQRASEAWQKDPQLLAALYNSACYLNLKKETYNALATLDLLAEKLAKRSAKQRQRFLKHARVDKDLMSLHGEVQFEKFLQSLSAK